MGIASFVLGILALMGACVNLIPLLGWANWFVLPVAGIGALLGFIGLFTQGKKVWAWLGLALNLISLGIAIVRLIIGAGIF